MTLRDSIGFVFTAGLVAACFNPDPAEQTGTETETESNGGSTSVSMTSADSDTGPTPGTTVTMPGDGSSTGTTNGPTSTTANTSSDSSDGGGSSSTGEPSCEPGSGAFGPRCEPCACANGICDDGMEGTGECTCDEGWVGTACDYDCGPQGTLNPDGSCTNMLPAIEDAFVCSGDWAADNYGFGNHTMRAVGQQNNFTGNQIGRAFYKFDLSFLPDGVAFSSERFLIKQYDNFAGFPMTVQLRPAPSTWDEGTLTWNNQPMVGAMVLGTSVVGCCGENHEFDIAGTVATVLDAGQDMLSLQLRSDDEAVIGGVRWFFHEGDGVMLGSITGEPPLLEIRYTVP